MENVTFIYRTSAADFSRTIRVKRMRGLTEPDEIEHNSPPIHVHLDGHLDKEIFGGKKSIELVVPALASEMDKRFVAAFILATAKSIAYAGPSSIYASEVVNKDARLVAQWMHAVEHGRSFTLLLEDVHVYKAWDDGIPIPEDDMFYFLNDIEVDLSATLDSPEVLVTNAGKLAHMQNGGSWPSFNSSTHDFFIMILCSNDCVAKIGWHASVSAGNMMITWFAGSGYVVNATGKVKVDLAIYPKLKTA